MIIDMSQTHYLKDVIHSYLHTYKEFGYVNINYNVGGTGNFVVGNEKNNECLCFQSHSPSHTNNHMVLTIGSSVSPQCAVASFTLGAASNYYMCRSSRFDKLLVGYSYSALNLAEFVIKRWGLPLQEHKDFAMCLEVRKLLKDCKISLNKTFFKVME
jgi:hypothetical protein